MCCQQIYTLCLMRDMSTASRSSAGCSGRLEETEGRMVGRGEGEADEHGVWVEVGQRTGIFPPAAWPQTDDKGV